MRDEYMTPGEKAWHKARGQMCRPVGWTRRDRRAHLKFCRRLRQGKRQHWRGLIVRGFISSDASHLAFIDEAYGMRAEHPRPEGEP